MKPREAKLDHQTLTRILDYNAETGVFTWKVKTANCTKVGAVTGCQTGNGHLSIRIRYTIYAAHRLAWFYVHKKWPEGQIDHINLIKTDNRLSNLREATSFQNRQNLGLRVDNSTGFKGVHRASRGDNYEASIGFNGKRIHLGTFDTPEKAHAAYIAASQQHHGEFARTR